MKPPRGVSTGTSGTSFTPEPASNVAQLGASGGSPTPAGNVVVVEVTGGVLASPASVPASMIVVVVFSLMPPSKRRPSSHVGPLVHVDGAALDSSIDERILQLVSDPGPIVPSVN